MNDETVVFMIRTTSNSAGENVITELKGRTSAIIAVLASSMYLYPEVYAIVQQALQTVKSPDAVDILHDIFPKKEPG